MSMYFGVSEKMPSPKVLILPLCCLVDILPNKFVRTALKL